MRKDKMLGDDPQARAYLQELDAQIDALEGRLNEARRVQSDLQRAVDALDGRTPARVADVLPGLMAAGRARLANLGAAANGRRWAVGAAAAVVAVGAGLTFAGSNGAPRLPNAISLQDRISVAEAADAPAATDINVVPAPLFTLDASDSPFDDAPAAGAPSGGAAVDMTAFDSPDDSVAAAPAPAAPAADSDSPDDVFAPGPQGDDSSDSPDDAFVPPSAPAPVLSADDSSDSPEAPRSFQVNSPDSSDSDTSDS